MPGPVRNTASGVQCIAFEVRKSYCDGPLDFKGLSQQSGVLTAFALRKVADRRGSRCAIAVQSPRAPCGDVYFENAQNKRHGLAFAQRVRQRAVGTL